MTSSVDEIVLLAFDNNNNKNDTLQYFLVCLLMALLSLKLVRDSFCEPNKQYKILLIAYLLNPSNDNSHKRIILIDLYLISIFMSKFGDFLEKLKFIYVYTAPWQLPWGSAFHAFAQPLAMPHTSFLLCQALVSACIGAPLMPLMGSAIFIMSYMRPVKFWEYTDATNGTRERVAKSDVNNNGGGGGGDSENLNAIFYEHLTSVLETSLCGDLTLGRWGECERGDFFLLSSDYLNCLVHLIECGNGFVTFQLRGLEFKGTYCQQRELEAITQETLAGDTNSNVGGSGVKYFSPILLLILRAARRF
jgi:hypothetical protein